MFNEFNNMKCREAAGKDVRGQFYDACDVIIRSTKFLENIVVVTKNKCI